jgi:hypothetical protein
MQLRHPAKVSKRARRAIEGVALAPMMFLLALTSIVITLVVAVGTVHSGRLPASGSIGLVCALVLAAVAVAEASRPARSERVRRRTTTTPASLEEASSADASIATGWRR